MKCNYIQFVYIITHLKRNTILAVAVLNGTNSRNLHGVHRIVYRVVAESVHSRQREERSRCMLTAYHLVAANSAHSQQREERSRCMLSAKGGTITLHADSLSCCGS